MGWRTLSVTGLVVLLVVATAGCGGEGSDAPVGTDVASDVRRDVRPAPDVGPHDQAADSPEPPDEPGADQDETDDGGPDDISRDHPPDGDASLPDTARPDVPYAMNVRVGFQYVGDGGGSHYVDDVVVTDAGAVVLIDEGFEGGELPAGWQRIVQRGFYTWEIHYGPNEAHSGDYSAKVTWYEQQDEWLVSPPLAGEGALTLRFWNRGSVDLAEAATLHVHYTCTDGYEWFELYAFPQLGELESYVWYENIVQFECP